MKTVKFLPILVAAITAFVASGLYYTLLGGTYAELRGIDTRTASITPQAWEMAGQFVRNIVVAYVFAYFINRFGIVTLRESLRLGLWAWLGFQAMQILGAVLHENYPIGLYAIHVGDALMTTLIMTSIIGVWAGKKGTEMSIKNEKRRNKMSDKNKEIVEKVNAAFADNKPEIFLSYCADDAQWSMVGDKTFNGKDAIKEFMASMGDMEPPKFIVDEIIVDGDSVACYGGMQMIETGKPSDYSFCDVYRFKNGRITGLKTFIVKHKTEGERSEKAAA